MNYQTQTPVCSVEAPKTKPLFDSILTRLSLLYDEQYKYLSLIEDKLHSIYNQSEPQNISANESGTPQAEVISKIDHELNRIDYSNSRLRKIASHLEKLV